jgi:hypothetical protein
VDAGQRTAGRRRGHRSRVVLVALALYAGCALWATWPATRNADDHYLARPALGHGEAAAGDHLQLGWSFWLVGHQLEHAASPIADPYSFQPEADAPPNLQGWLYGLPYWPLARPFGDIWAYNLIVWLSFILTGGFTALWLRALGLRTGAALVGGVVFALAPYRVGQSTGHLLGLVSFLLPAVLLAMERRRLLVAAVVLAAIPLSGQLHLALGAVPLVLGYGWARLPRSLWPRVGAAVIPALAVGVVIGATVVSGSVGSGRSFAQVEKYSATLSDFVTRNADGGIERFVFIGWLTPLLALVGLVFAARRRSRGLALCLGLAALIPSLLAMGSNLPGYRRLWDVAPGLGATRVPERLLPIACLALAALVSLALERALVTIRHKRWLAVALVTAAVAVIAVDLRVPVFGAVEADGPSVAYAAIKGDGALIELPIFQPGVHFGSVYLGYARQSPRSRPQGYSTLAPRAADAWALAHRGLSCGRGAFPRDIGWIVVHRGLYAQSGFFGPDCVTQAELALAAAGWVRVAHEGALTTYRAPRS